MDDTRLDALVDQDLAQERAEEGPASLKINFEWAVLAKYWGPLIVFAIVGLMIFLFR